MKYPIESYQTKDQKLVDVLNENGDITGSYATKKEVHDKKLWHNEVAIFIIREDGKILLQKRSQNVHFNKGKWGMIANHVGVDQPLVEALLEKSKEEIGYAISPEDIRYLTVQQRDEEREKRFTYFYYIKTTIKDEDIVLNPYLAVNKKWFDFNELQEKMITNSDDVVFKNTPAYINIFGELGEIIKGRNTDVESQEQRFILVRSTDGCFHPGALYRSGFRTKKIIISIHGSGANFYKTDYFDDIIKELAYKKIDFMSVNNRGSEQFIRIYKKNNGKSIPFMGGNMYENFDESIYDIEGAIQYAKDNEYQDIYLVGHSLGTLKVLYYVKTMGMVRKIILISPVDMISRFRSRVGADYDAYIEQSEKYVEQGKGNELLTKEFSALKIYSTMRVGSNSDIIRVEKERITHIPINYTGSVSIIQGTSDHCYKNWNMDDLKNLLQKQFANAEFQFHVINNADHMYKNYEKQLSRKILESVLSMNVENKQD